MMVTCEACGKVFGSNRTFQEVEKEMKMEFGDIAPENRAVVCHDCYLKIMEMMSQTEVKH